LAGVRISELPVVNVFQDSDVIVLNENNSETSQIGMSYFVTSLTSKDLVFTGKVQLNNEISVGGEIDFNNTVDFNNSVNFYDPVVFFDEITLNGVSGVGIDDLDDVTTSGLNTPTNGQALVWNTGVNNWIPGKGGGIDSVVDDLSPQLGGDLDVNGFKIASRANGDVVIQPDGTGIVRINSRANNTLSAQLRLYGRESLRYVGLEAPPEDDITLSYNLVLPSSPGTNGQALLTDGTGKLSWGDGGGGDGSGSGIELIDLSVRTGSAKDGGELTYNDLNGEFLFNPADLTPYLTQIDVNDLSIDELTDVDTTTNVPTSGQTLIWDETNDNWVPGDVSIENGKLNDLDDVYAPLPTEGDILVYNNNLNQWQNESNLVPKALVFQGSCNLTKITSDSDNDDVQDNVSERLTGYFWVNSSGNEGPIDPSWTGLSGSSVGLEYVAWNEQDEFVILGRTGQLNAVLEIEAGEGISVINTDPQIPIISLTDTGVVAGDYNIANISVDDKGRITSVSSGSVSGNDIETILLDYLPLVGGTMTDFITLHADPTDDLHASTKRYVDELENRLLGDATDPLDDGILGNYIKASGGHMYGDLTFGPTVDDTDVKLSIDEDTGNVYTTGTVTAADFIKLDGSSVGGSTEIGENPPETPSDGDFWFNSENGIFYVYYTDDDSSQWVSIAGGGGSSAEEFNMSMIDIPSLSALGEVVSGSTTYVVTVVSTGDGNKYSIDGSQQPALSLTQGQTYIFNQSDSSNSGHPLKIYTDSSKTTEVTAGVTTSGSTTTFIPESYGTFSYQCGVHAGMGGSITVI
jgi:plastocyanin